MPIIKANTLRAVAQAVVEATGSDAEEAYIVADHLVTANLQGHDSHGVGMIPRYIQNFNNGLVTPNRPAKLIADLGAILQFDGGKGYGQRVARDATNVAINRAGETGVCLYTLRNAHHVGRIGDYGQMAIDAGLGAILFVNVADHRPSVAPYGGGEARLITNPVCIAIPGAGDTECLLLDMATASVALGKIRVAANTGKQVEEGLLYDPKGEPTTDPTVMFPELLGALTPFGGHKGSGLGLMAEILGGILSGGRTIQPGSPREDGILNSLFGIVFDPLKLVSKDHFANELSSTIEYVKSAKPLDAATPVLVAGEPERQKTKDRLENGVDVDAVTWRDILAAAESLGLDPNAFSSVAQ